MMTRQSRCVSLVPLQLKFPKLKLQTLLANPIYKIMRNHTSLRESRSCLGILEATFSLLNNAFALATCSFLSS